MIPMRGNRQRWKQGSFGHTTTGHSKLGRSVCYFLVDFGASFPTLGKRVWSMGGFNGRKGRLWSISRLGRTLTKDSKCGVTLDEARQLMAKFMEAL